MNMFPMPERTEVAYAISQYLLREAVGFSFCAGQEDCFLDRAAEAWNAHAKASGLAKRVVVKPFFQSEPELS